MQMNIYLVQAYLQLPDYFSWLFFGHCQEDLSISWPKHLKQ